jgi:Sulfotransferase family
MSLLSRLRSRLASGEAPVPFIVGSSRSGTTMLRLMLDSHPDLAIPPETGFLPAVSELEGQGEALRERFFEAIVSFPANAPAWDDFQISAEAFRSRLGEIRPFTVADGIRLFYRLYAARFGKPRWGDKTPLYSHHLRAIQKLLPEARFVHLVRDGRDAAVSLRERWFSPGHDIAVQATFWRDNLLAARREGNACRHFLEVRFEDLVREPETALRRICGFIALDFRPEMLRHDERAPQRLAEHGARYTADGSLLLSREDRRRQQAQSCQLPAPEKIGAWRHSLSAEECRRFEEIAGDLLGVYGYSRYSVSELTPGG